MFTLLPIAQRMHQLNRPLIALTGGIGTGKTTVAAMLAAHGFPIINADQLVKKIYAKPASILFVQTHFPECVAEGKILFPELRKHVFSVPENKTKIENFIYPQLPDAFMEELQTFSEKRFVVYDVPLLFERHMENQVDFIILAYANKETQVKRVMQRDQVDNNLALKIIHSQMDIEEKKKKSHYIVDNSLGLEELKSAVDLLSSKLLAFFNKA